MKTPPVPAVVPPVGASPPSSSSASGSPAECACGRYALFHIQLRKSGSVDTRQWKCVMFMFHLICGFAFLLSTDVRERTVTTRWSSSPSNCNRRFQQIFPWQQWFDSSSALVTTETGTVCVWYNAEDAGPPGISGPPTALLKPAFLAWGLPNDPPGCCCCGLLLAAWPLGCWKLRESRTWGCIQRHDWVTDWQLLWDYCWCTMWGSESRPSVKK